MTIAERTYGDAGLPIEHTKTVDLVSTITFLGMELDTELGVICITNKLINKWKKIKTK